MLVMRRVYAGPDGSERFALDQRRRLSRPILLPSTGRHPCSPGVEPGWCHPSRSAATTLFGLAFIQEWTISPWSLLMHNDESLMHTCSRLPVSTGMHVDPSSSEMANLASPVERRRHLEALAGGLKSIYMLHAEEDLVVQFASWVQGAFEGMEAKLLESA
jgi:hypothetical protein